MELKGYQQKVINDIETYLEYLQKYKRTDRAFDKFWEDRIGDYNPLTNQGMRPYQNNVKKAVHICMKVPTAGGKTYIACNTLKTIFDAFPTDKPKAVVWLVPWSNLLDQTYNNLNNPEHPYTQRLNSLFNHKVKVYLKKDLLQGSDFNPSTVQEHLSIFIMSFASIRAKNKDDRKIYEQNGQLKDFADNFKNDSHVLENTDETALINVIRNLNPIIILDESHNAESDLSVDMLKDLNPCFILDLTATPRDNSNIISFVPAIELKKENMVKLPVIVYNHHDKNEVIESALHLQKRLEILALEEEKTSGKYIRPIVLFQAQAATNEDNTTFEKLKTELLKLKIPEEQIKIKTANINELKDEDLKSRDCKVRYIITINALKEGWDCPFAYILASLADKSSAVDVEQILGRVLRQPYVMKHNDPKLNVSYVLTASSKFNDTLQNIVRGLQNSGFSEKDYRKKDVFETQDTRIKTQDSSSNIGELNFDDNNIDTSKIKFDPDNINSDDKISAVDEITNMAIEQNREFEKQIEEESPLITDNLLNGMGDKVKRYKIRSSLSDKVKGIVLPQFYLEVPKNEIFGTENGLIPLNQEALLDKFKLAEEDIKIDFENVSSDLYKVDLQEKQKDDYAPTFTKIEDSTLKDPFIDFILSKPRENQIRVTASHMMELIGDLFPIPDQDIQLYVERILKEKKAEQLQDFIIRKYTYKDKIRKYIKALADKSAENRFNDYVKIGKIITEPAWKFTEYLLPGNLGPSIANSLYESEGSMNKFEEKIILDISSLPNILFWHRNLVRGTGFAINGFKSNHYPDFVLYTKTNKIVLIETKGDDRDNTDSEAKCRLGNKWAEMAGIPKFNYYMVFESKAVAGAYNIDKAKELIRGL